MIKKRELTDPQSCLNRAGPDEPVFVLRANDQSAPEAVRAWITRYCFDRAGGAGYDALTILQKRKVNEALTLADSMEKWRHAKYSN